MKSGVLAGQVIGPGEITALAVLPSLDALRAQLISLLTKPATMLVQVLNAPASDLVGVVQAKVRAEGG